jgi:YD repeat-containing protein
LLLPTCVFIYDARDQLLGTDHSNQTDEIYGYDDNGNRTNNGYQTGSNNQLLSDGTYTFTYDTAPIPSPMTRHLYLHL